MPDNTDITVCQTPLVIGVTGHRDLVAEELDQLAVLIRKMFEQLQTLYPHTPLRIMSALAEGADRLAAQVALDNELSVNAILPMSAELYRDDFETDESKREFDAICEQSEVLTLPVNASDGENIKTPGPARDRSYANAGMFISAHCHILLALWDGVKSDQLGGTAQIIYFQHYDRLPGIAESVPRSSLFLTDDESDLVYHISCSRKQSPNNPDAVPPLQCSWFTTDPDAPVVGELPLRYTHVFQRTDQYNYDIQRLLERGRPLQSSEAMPPDTLSRKAALHIRDEFDVADNLANYYQKRVGRTLAGIYILAFLTGVTFILYSELSGFDPAIYAFLAFILLAIILTTIAKKREWHRKYLDYRVLAEGLRVQFFHAIAGIHGEGHTKFAYDNFLRQRDMDLGWIRNVMRVAGIHSDGMAADKSPQGLQFSIDHWIGCDKTGGQHDYYKKRASQRARINFYTDLVTMVCLWSGITVACVLAFFMKDPDSEMRDLLIILMGVLPLVAGVAEVYTQRKADRELTKQYQFMEHVFANARRRLNEAVSDSERREILQGLGDAALSEHAEWILVHRERQPEPGGF